MNRKIKSQLIVFIAAVALSAVIRPGTAARADDRGGRIELDQTSFTVKTWQGDGAHLAEVKGKLTLGGQPVAHALVQAGAQGRSIPTEEDGSFGLTVDRSLIAQKTVRVASVRDATIAGKPIGQQEAAAVLAASSMIRVYLPIEVSRVTPSEREANQVQVHARFKVGNGDKISFFQVDKYRISGQVTDADGRPVENAIVWIDRDGGEGFAKSTPTDRNGTYELYFWPEEEETNLTVIVGTRRYALPEGKVFMLPRHTSVDIRIRLPKEGSVIDDKPPGLVCTTSKGAVYTGLLAGLDVPSGTPYSVTIPDRQGRFMMTLPRDAWEQHPAFFETLLTKFIERGEILKAGDELPAGFVQPREQDPRLPAAAS